MSNLSSQGNIYIVLFDDRRQHHCHKDTQDHTLGHAIHWGMDCRTSNHGNRVDIHRFRREDCKFHERRSRTGYNSFQINLEDNLVTKKCLLTPGVSKS